MKSLFLTTAHNSLSQRLLIELTDRGHDVAVTLASNDEAMLKGAAENEPELIIAPARLARAPFTRSAGARRTRAPSPALAVSKRSLQA